jgi:hypothetical protein
MGQQYRITTPVLGIHSADGRRTTVVIRAGARVVLDNEPAGGARMITVTWEGRAVTMFAADLTAHGIQWQNEGSPRNP